MSVPGLTPHPTQSDWSCQAQRDLFSKFLSQLHTCLKNGHRYDEGKAFLQVATVAA